MADRFVRPRRQQVEADSVGYQSAENSADSKNPAAPIYGGWVRVLFGGSRWQSALPTGSKWQSALPTRNICAGKRFFIDSGKKSR